LSAVALLEKEYRDPDVTISRICHEAFISESTFRRLFTQQFGKSPIRYLSELRLHLAEELLLSTDMTVEQISMATGFRDPKYFCRFVKHHRGCTPTELRTF